MHACGNVGKCEESIRTANGSWDTCGVCLTVWGNVFRCGGNERSYGGLMEGDGGMMKILHFG